jgi:putative phosphoribosyl transferase
MLITALKNRKDAGLALASRLREYSGGENAVVLGLPKGGVPVAFEIAKSLEVPLDVFVAGKLGFPGQPELAMGAVTSQGIRVFNADLLEQSGYSGEELERLVHRKILELERKEALFRQGGAPAGIEGRTIIIVDDGAATGASMRAALQALRRMNPKTVIAAVPVASEEGLHAIEQEADETVCLQTPSPFHSVGQWYEDFRQVEDEEVIGCLHEAKEWLGTAGPPEARQAD